MSARFHVVNRPKRRNQPCAAPSLSSFPMRKKLDTTQRGASQGGLLLLGLFISNDWESQNCYWMLFSVTRFLISRTPYSEILDSVKLFDLSYCLVWLIIQVWWRCKLLAIFMEMNFNLIAGYCKSYKYKVTKLTKPSRLLSEPKYRNDEKTVLTIPYCYTTSC